MFTNVIARVASRRRVSRVVLTGAFAALLGVYTGCGGGGGGGPVSVPLQYRPTHAEPLTGTSINAADVKVHLAQVVDKRQDKETIGQNVEDDDKAPVPVYAADTTPGEFVRQVMEDELKNFGVELVDAPEAADRIIAIDLNKFWCEEGNNYRAEVRGTAEVRNKGGSSLWKGPIGGDGRTFGRSLSPTNYNEALSDATRRTVGSLIGNPGFAKALQR
jgi:hypothetical protein